MEIAIVIPAFNEASRIGFVLSELKKKNLPVIVVDDGSKDKTSEVAKKHKAIVLKHRINLGKGAALKTGSEFAFGLGAQVVIIMDSDGQHLVSDLDKFVRVIKEKKFDLVFGVRNLGLGTPFIRYMGNKIASALISILFGIYISDLICGYRAFTQSAFKKINWQSSDYGVETEMVIMVGKLGLKYCEVPVETIYYDKFKGVSIIDAFSILFNVFKWRLTK